MEYKEAMGVIELGTGGLRRITRVQVVYRGD